MEQNQAELESYRDILKKALLAESPLLRDPLSVLAKQFGIQYNFVPLAHLIVQLIRESVRHEIMSAPEGTVSRSNWTYLIAFSMLSVARTLHINIRFEAEGKRDAIFEHPRSKAKKVKQILAAEWEWDSRDVFGASKEIDKLFQTCKKDPDVAALLLTYVESTEFADFASKVHNSWVDLTKGKFGDLALYLMVVIYENANGSRQFLCIRTCEISASGFMFWEDISVS